jgi:hypothetical protein
MTDPDVKRRVGRKNGGADRIRTCDLLIANETLYQLSYDPIHADSDSLGTERRQAQLRTLTCGARESL